MCVMTKEGLQRMVVDCAMRLRMATKAQRCEGMEFLIFAREWIRIGDLDGAHNAMKNSLSVLRPLWKTERFKSVH